VTFADRACKKCVEAEQKNAKLTNQTCFKGLLTIEEHQNFQGKLIVGGAAVACIVSHVYPIFMALASCKIL